MGSKTQQALPPPQALRLDIWLWRARFFKSRAISARTIRLGCIRLHRDGQTLRLSKPHTLIKPTDQLVFMRAEELFQIEVLSLGTRRGPAPEARALYGDILHAHPKVLTA